MCIALFSAVLHVSLLVIVYYTCDCCTCRRKIKKVFSSYFALFKIVVCKMVDENCVTLCLYCIVVQPAQMPSQSSWYEPRKDAVHIFWVRQQVCVSSGGDGEKLQTRREANDQPRTDRWYDYTPVLIFTPHWSFHVTSA